VLEDTPARRAPLPQPYSFVAERFHWIDPDSARRTGIQAAINPVAMRIRITAAIGRGVVDHRDGVTPAFGRANMLTDGMLAGPAAARGMNTSPPRTKTARALLR